jgi:hypothetical protein
MNWIEVPAGKYKILSPSGRKSHCQIEISMGFALCLSCTCKTLLLRTIIDVMILSRMHLKENGKKLHHYGSSVLISNVLAEKASSQNLV